MLIGLVLFGEVCGWGEGFSPYFPKMADRGWWRCITLTYSYKLKTYIQVYIVYYILYSYAYVKCMSDIVGKFTRNISNDETVSSGINPLPINNVVRTFSVIYLGKRFPKCVNHN